VLLGRRLRSQTSICVRLGFPALSSKATSFGSEVAGSWASAWHQPADAPTSRAPADYRRRENDVCRNALTFDSTSIPTELSAPAVPSAGHEGGAADLDNADGTTPDHGTEHALPCPSSKRRPDEGEDGMRAAGVLGPRSLDFDIDLGTDAAVISTDAKLTRN